MPRLHPRQLLIREAIAVGSAGLVALGLSCWWSSTQPHLQIAPIMDAPQDSLAPAAPAPPPSQLWRPLTDAPIASSPPPPTPGFRLITLSQRQGAWTALVDPGNGQASERVRLGDQFAGWTVAKISSDGVELTNGPHRHDMKLLP